MEYKIGYIIIVILYYVHVHVVSMCPCLAHRFDRIEVVRHLCEIRIVDYAKVKIHATRNVEEILVIVVEVAVFDTPYRVHHLGTEINRYEKI